MLKYLLNGISEDFYKKQIKILEQNTGKLELTTLDSQWLAATYVYAKKNNLKEYQARSFASELTLFLTGKMYDTNVNLIYREDWLDSHLYSKFEEISQRYPKRNKSFWLEFIKYMMEFYSTSLSWKYERISKFLQFRITAEEKEIFEEIPRPKPKQKFIYLLEHFDYEIIGIEYKRRGKRANVNWSINLSVSEYERFMEVLGGNKTEKFLSLLYYWYANLNAGNFSLND